MSAPASVYERVLGDAFEALHPTLQRYFGALPDGHVGRGSGVYAEAGSRHRWLAPVWAWLAYRRILFPEWGRDVPFTVENRRTGDGLAAARRFCFPRVVRRMEDAMRVVDGRLLDRLGRRGGLEVALAASVQDGGMRLRSTALALRTGRMRLPLPRFAEVTISESVDPGEPDRQRVDARITVPLLGEVFRYRGTFVYRVEPASAASSQPRASRRTPSLD